MDTPTFNAQRGVPYSPAQAREQREKDALRAASELARAARAEERRQHARYLDQVEACYRERKKGRRGKWSS